MLSITELNDMRYTQSGTMQDLVNITTRTPYTNDYGDTLYSGIVQSGVYCGWQFTGGSQSDKGATNMVEYDATVRFPLTTTIHINDTITLVQKMGEVHNETFEVWTSPRYGASVQKVQVKRKKL